MMASRRNMPKAPEIISNALMADIATRALRKALKYSTTWKRASQLAGMPI